MQAYVDEVSVAFTYAWWLTGEDETAEMAVRRAVREVPDGGDATARLGRLLRAVRAAAAPEPTMCPASEVALLHDGYALPLELAADLVHIPSAEARTELAHGRLEALIENPPTSLLHPERLGGLAVGNPPDVAHTRTCDSCLGVRELLRRGREELLALPEIPLPPSLLSDLTHLGLVVDDAPVEPSDDQPAGASPAAAGPGDIDEDHAPYTPGYEDADPDEIYYDDEDDEQPSGGRLLSYEDLRALEDTRTSGLEEQPPATAPARMVLGAVVVLIVIIALIISTLGGDGDGDAEGTQGAALPAPVAATVEGVPGLGVGQVLASG